MRIFVGSDYRGFELKNSIMEYLISNGYDASDLGAHAYNEGDDFNDPAIAVSLSVRDNPGSRGILICGSAHGVTIQANRYKGIRAAHCDSVESARLAREHDDANILCLSGEFLDIDTATKIIDTFLKTDFKCLERRLRRIERLDEGMDYD